MEVLLGELVELENVHHDARALIAEAHWPSNIQCLTVTTYQNRNPWTPLLLTSPTRQDLLASFVR